MVFIAAFNLKAVHKPRDVGRVRMLRSRSVVQETLRWHLCAARVRRTRKVREGATLPHTFHSIRQEGQVRETGVRAKSYVPEIGRDRERIVPPTLPKGARQRL